MDRKEQLEKWNENVETCSDCGIKLKKIGKHCPVCYAPDEKRNNLTKLKG